MDPSLVSVVIPTYNRARSIARAVDSVLSQDYAAIEVVVVDDGSRDETAQVMKARFGGDPRVIFIQQPNGGVCVARNTGMARARGEFIAMLDSDDAWLPGKLSMQVTLLQRHPELSLVWTDMAAVDPQGQVLWPSFQHRMFDAHRYLGGFRDLFLREHVTPSGLRYLVGDLARPMILGNLMLTSTVVARAANLRRAGEYDQSCHPSEDHDFYFRLCRTGPVAFVDAPTVHYTIGGEDAASGPRRSVQLSTSFLEVLRRRQSSDQELIASLPPGALEQALSDGHAWAGYAHFNAGLMPQARAFYWKRLKARPRDLSSARYLAASFLPAGALGALRKAKALLRA